MSQKTQHQKLNQWFATAICGNDILSSSLYVSGIAIIFAGVLAPLVLLFIAFVLFLYKSVYTEVVEALPVNGGAYNCLLNGTSKIIAATAGITTFLSYIATAVISATVGVEYLHTIFAVPVIPATIALLGFFASLVIAGIKDSAKVALGFFSLHILSLTAFLILGLVYFLSGHSHFAENISQTGTIISHQGNLLMAFYLAFSASLLGVSGFESSANFVEEQQPGVFRKTLRNMLIGVAIFNPLIALVVLNSMDFTSIVTSKDFLLSDAAKVIGGNLFQYLIVGDAFLVLSGAVLTGYVGVSGLLSRMTADGCLPGFFNKVNNKGSSPRIIVSFFILCSSILLLTRGNLLSLAGVYTIAFLGVMSLFAFGNLILRETRTELKRTYQAPLLFVVLAFTATFFGMIGNIRIDENNLKFFELYFIPAFLMILLVIYWDLALRFLMRATRSIPFLHRYLQRNFQNTIKGEFVAFIHNIDKVYSILNYVNRNETGWNITLIHCRCDDHKTLGQGAEDIRRLIREMQQAGVFPHLNIKVVFRNEYFGPEVIDKVAEEMNINKNRIMIGSIHEHHPYDYEDLRGVRIIF